MTLTIQSHWLHSMSSEVATMQFNQLSGSVPDGICDVDTLEVFTVDCLGAPGRPSPPYVACPCCSFCY